MPQSGGKWSVLTNERCYVMGNTRWCGAKVCWSTRGVDMVAVHSVDHGVTHRRINHCVRANTQVTKTRSTSADTTAL